MKPTVNWSNPYAQRKGQWLRGNLHTHTKEGSGCGVSPLNAMLQQYRESGYDFLCISDHMFLRDIHHPSLILIPGIEWNSPRGEHTGIYTLDRKLLENALGISDQQILLHSLADKDVLLVLNHPNWEEPPHYRREQLAEKRFFHGIEIYNGVIELLIGTALSTDKWDYLLTRKHRALGFAHDDAHATNQVGNGWLMARCAQRTPRAVLDALRRGNFYCSSGVTITDIRREGMVVTVETEDAQEIQAIGAGGVRLARVSSSRMDYDLSTVTSPYVRFVAYGRGSSSAWTQPFFLDSSHLDKWTSPFVTDWRMSKLLKNKGDITSSSCVRLADNLAWKTLKGQDQPVRGFVNAHAPLQDADGIVYFANRFRVAKAGRWQLNLGHDGGAKVFVDGKSVLCQPVRLNPAMPGRSKAIIELTRGTHEIVIAFDTDHGMGWGFFLNFSIPEENRGKGCKPWFPQMV